MASVEVNILGADQAVRLGKRVIEHSDGRLEDQVVDAIHHAHHGIGDELRRAVFTHLPRRNGLAAEVATAHIDVQRLGDGVRVTADHQYHLPGLDQGMNVHPLFGNRRHWYGQRVRAGWFTDTMERHQHTTTRQFVEQACDRFAADLEG